MKAEARIEISDDNDNNDSIKKVSSEKRSVNSDRRISNGNTYKGPARRMNLDRRK